MVKKRYIDIEPKWVDLVEILIETKNRHEIRKMAVIADEVRQAQKKKQRLVYDFREKKKLRKVV